MRGALLAVQTHMRLPILFRFATGLCAIAACGPSQKPSAGGATTSTPPPPAQTPSTTPPPGAPEKASTTSPEPIRGKTVTVNMVGDAKGYRYEPSKVTLSPGDGIKFVNVSGGPHNVTFWPDSVPSGAAKALSANMPNTTAPLTGPLMVTPNETYTISFTGAPSGVYHFYCTPHLALGMKGSITVQ